MAAQVYNTDFSYVGEYVCWCIPRFDTSYWVNVSGIVDLPRGTSLTIPLLDNGAGADSIANDGVYSGSMLSSQFTDNGFYGLKVSKLVVTVIDFSQTWYRPI